jgi:hypothetical protein
MTEAEKLAEVRALLSVIVDDPHGFFGSSGRAAAAFVTSRLVAADEEVPPSGSRQLADAVCRELAESALSLAADVRAMGDADPKFAHGYLVLFTDPDDDRPRRLLGMYFTEAAATAAADRCVAAQGGADAEDNPHDPEMFLGPDAVYEIVPVSFEASE